MSEIDYVLKMFFEGNVLQQASYTHNFKICRFVNSFSIIRDYKINKHSVTFNIMIASLRFQ